MFFSVIGVSDGVTRGKKHTQKTDRGLLAEHITHVVPAEFQSDISLPLFFFFCLFLTHTHARADGGQRHRIILMTSLGMAQRWLIPTLTRRQKQSPTL